MALDMIGQVTGMDLFLVERQGRKAVEKTAQNFQASIDRWEAHANDLKQKLQAERDLRKSEQCHSAGLSAQYNLMKKLIADNNGPAYLTKSRMVQVETGTQLSLSQLAYCEAYNVKAKELNVQQFQLRPL